jgi:RNA polymerase sigma-70 factor, ECF subfamily
MLTTEKLTIEFELARKQMRSYLLRMTASIDDSNDIVQDTFIRAFENIASFKGDSSVKTWLFSIACNLAKNNLKAKKRWPENVNDICKDAALSNPEFFAQAMQIRQSSPQGNFEIREHITFCFTCISKSLPLEQQLCIMLKEVYEFKVDEIALIIDNTEAMVKYYLHSARTKMVKIFDGRCSLINKQGICHQCTELNGIFNPQQKAQEELAKIDLARAAENPDKEHLLDLRMRIVKDIDPFESPAAELQLHHLQHNRLVMENIT